MLSEHIHQYITYVALILIAFTLPLHDKFNSIPLILLGLNWLLEGRFKEKGRQLWKNKIFFVYMGFYLLYLIGMSYSSNWDYGEFDLQVKVTLFLFPLLIGATPYLKKQQLLRILQWFALGCLIAGLLCLGRASYFYFFKDTNVFFYKDFSFILHAGYFATYLNFSFAFIAYRLVTNLPNKQQFVLRLLLLVFITFLIVLLASKVGLVQLVCNVIGLVLLVIIKKKRFILGSVFLVAFLGGLLIIINILPVTKNRIQNVAGDTKLLLKTGDDDIKKLARENVRMAVWISSLNIIRENLLLGVGTGDVKEALYQKYNETEIRRILGYKYNAHNQFFQTTLSIGVIGGIYLLIILLYPGLKGVNSRDYVIIMFIIFVFIFFMVESALERQMGVVFYAFFNSILSYKLIK